MSQEYADEANFQGKGLSVFKKSCLIKSVKSVYHSPLADNMWFTLKHVFKDLTAENLLEIYI